MSSLLRVTPTRRPSSAPVSRRLNTRARAPRASIDPAKLFRDHQINVVCSYLGLYCYTVIDTRQETIFRLLLLRSMRVEYLYQRVASTSNDKLGNERTTIVHVNLKQNKG